MNKGKIKWFNIDKGYGFIVPDNGDRDIFVHITAMKRCGISSLETGQDVWYKTSDDANDRMVVSEISTKNMYSDV